MNKQMDRSTAVVFAAVDCGDVRDVVRHGFEVNLAFGHSLLCLRVHVHLDGECGCEPPCEATSGGASARNCVVVHRRQHARTCTQKQRAAFVSMTYPHDMLGKELIARFVAHVPHDEDEVETGQDGWQEVDVFCRRHVVLVAAVCSTSAKDTVQRTAGSKQRPLRISVSYVSKKSHSC